MLGFLLGLFRLIWPFGKGHHAVALENLALRQQLSVYQRKRQRPRLIGWDRWFWIALSMVWEDWRRAVVVVQPDTVVRWQRERFRRYWANLSKKPARLGRPPVPSEIWELIRTLAERNPPVVSTRIHGELQNVGIEVLERTVSRILRTVKWPPSQTWKTFLQNHIGEIVAISDPCLPLREAPRVKSIPALTGKQVIHQGKIVQEVFDGNQRSQAQDWVLLDIFAPFRAEHTEEVPFGTLWHRGRAMSVATVCLWCGTLVVTLTFLSLVHTFTASGVFLLYAVVCAAAFVFVWRKVPETKERSLEEIEKWWLTHRRA